MKNTLYAVVAACLAMFATSGIVAMATAAPAPAAPTPAEVDAALVADLDQAIAAQLHQIQNDLGVSRVLRAD